MTDEDDDAKKRRADQLRKKISELTSESGNPSPDSAAQRPGESDAEYVHRRMREVDRKRK